MRLSPRRLASLNPASLTLATIALVVALWAVGVPLLDLIELKTYDFRMLSRGPAVPSPAVVMAVIDEKSLDAEGRWPWPRSKIAALIDLLSRDGARVIGFDIGFLEPDENSQVQVLGEVARQVETLGIRNPRLDAFMAERGRQADHDRALAEAMRRSSAAVVLGYFFHMREADLNYRLAPAEIDRRLAGIGGSKYPLVRVKGGGVDAVPFVRAHAPETNLELFTGAAAASGYFSVMNDPDGIVRWMPLAIRSGEEVFPPLAVVSAWHYLGKPPLMVSAGPYGVEGIRLGDRVIPTDERGRLLINYLGPPKTFPHLSITDILRGAVPPGTFTDKLVLVGATATGIHDLRSTPVGPVYPGMEIHATVIDNILRRDFLARPDWEKTYDLVAIVALGLLIGLALPRMAALKGLLFAAGVFLLYILATGWLFANAKLWLNNVYPLLALSASYTVLTAYYYVTEERERKKIKETFRHYVAPMVVEEMLKAPGRLKLGGEEKVLTVLFSDLEGFTSYSEKYTPSEMIGILSEYYNRVTEQIFANRGTLKEYVGDELMAIFGAPMEQPDHAERACIAALAMREARLALCAEWAQTGRPLLRARTGINSGLMLVGNLGSKYRFAYGALGDHVNLGSRLEGLNKTYGTDILLAENTARLVEGRFRLREVDMVRVKGRQQPVGIYELLAKADAALPRGREETLKAYAAGLEAYRAQLWDQGLELFDEALRLTPEDGPSRTMAQRCQLFQKTPPSEGWDGVFVQIDKK